MRIGRVSMSHPSVQPPRRRCGRNRRMVFVIILVGIVLASFLAGCGGDSQTGAALPASETSAGEPATGAAPLEATAGEDGLQEAKKNLSEARLPSQFEAPGPPFDPTPARGTVIYHLPNFMELEFTSTYTAAFVDVMESFGAKVELRDNRGSPQKVSQFISEAIAQDADAILIDSIKSSAVSAPIASARDAGIPVIQLFEHDAGPVPADERALGVVAQVSYCYSCAGKFMADFVTVDSGGEGTAAVWDSSDVGTSQEIVRGFQEELERVCQECTIAEIFDAPVPSWAQLIPTQAAAAVKNPNMGYLVGNFDSMATWQVPAVHEAGAEDRVKVLGVGGEKSFLEQMENDPVLAGLPYNPQTWMGWAIADQTLRVLTGTVPVEDEKVKSRFFDRTNIPDLAAPEATWSGTDFQSGYRELWGRS